MFAFLSQLLMNPNLADASGGYYAEPNLVKATSPDACSGYYADGDIESNISRTSARMTTRTLAFVNTSLAICQVETSSQNSEI